MQITQHTALYLMVNDRSMASMSKSLAEVYRENRDEDGFLYITYASQEMFGWHGQSSTKAQFGNFYPNDLLFTCDYTHFVMYF